MATTGPPVPEQRGARSRRRWLWIGGVVVVAGLFLHFCVRIVPGSAQPASAEVSHAQREADRAFEDVGPGAGPDEMTIPVQGVRASELVDTFTQAREHGERPHDAIDILAPLGTPVLAASDGRVEKLFVSRLGGNTLYERSPDGRWMFYYAHLSAYAPGLSEGQRVRQGDVIGTVGYSGNADPTAPHLHFAVHRMNAGDPWYRGLPINPYPLLRK